MAFTNNPSSTSDGQSVEITDFPTSIEAGNSFTVPFEIETGNVQDPEDLSVSVTAEFYYNGTDQESKKRTKHATVTENETIKDSFSWRTKTNAELKQDTDAAPETGYPEGEVPSFIKSGYPRTVSNIFVRAILEYRDSSSTVVQTDTLDTLASSSDNKREISITAPIDEQGVAEFQDEDPGLTGENVLSDTFDRTDFYIKGIRFEEDASFVNSNFDSSERRAAPEGAEENLIYRISLDEKFGNPNVSIDSSGRFVKHEIIGGTTVRQKVGEDPLNVSVSGVCTERTANQIDILRDAKSGIIIGPRMPGSAGQDTEGGSLRVQFGSTSTEPIEDGGGAMFSGENSGELLYSYEINAIEVLR